MRHPLRFALSIDSRNYDGRPWRDHWDDYFFLMVEAERLGFDLLLVNEHFFTGTAHVSSVPAFLSVLAERTHRARLGTYIQIMPLHNPFFLAQELAVLDHLSDGRVEFGFGMGHSVPEFQAAGIAPASRVSRTEDALGALVAAWTIRPLTYRSAHFNVDGIAVEPVPLQKPHPPLWIAATSPRAASRAVRFGANVHCVGTDPALYEAYRSAWRERWGNEAYGRVSSSWSVTVTDEPSDRAYLRHQDLYRRRWEFYSRMHDEMSDPQLDFGHSDADPYRAYELIGSADHVVDVLADAVVRLGVTDVVHSGPVPGIDPRTEGFELIARFAEEVMAPLRREFAT